jgi:hypothetical protein
VEIAPMAVLVVANSRSGFGVVNFAVNDAFHDYPLLFGMIAR